MTVDSLTATFKIGILSVLSIILQPKLIFYVAEL